MRISPSVPHTLPSPPCLHSGPGRFRVSTEHGAYLTCIAIVINSRGQGSKHHRNRRVDNRARCFIDHDYVTRTECKVVLPSCAKISTSAGLREERRTDSTRDSSH